jgi:HD-GYP domain-containing protein (c-di-GMP phosphodiesterase class II)
MIPGIELHHESLDGRGYPHGLKGDDSPLLPRIIAVADTFDALTTNRPYQHAHEVHEALRIIHSLAGKRLDPVPVFALDAVYQRGEIRIQRPALPAQAVAPPVKAAVAASKSTPPEVRVDSTAAIVETSRF